MKVFIGSSKESIEYMEQASRWLEDLEFEVFAWTDASAFPPGTSTLPRLLEISRSVDAALLIFGEDDIVWYRDDAIGQPRDNVLLEYGIFASHLGPERAVVIRCGGAKMATNLAGLTSISLTTKTKARARRQLQVWAEDLRNSPMSRYKKLYIAAEHRNQLASDYARIRRSTVRNDVMAVALNGALNQYLQEPLLLEQSLTQRAAVRLLFLSPEASYVAQRAREDGVPESDLRRRLCESVMRAAKVGRKLQGLYDAAREEGGLDPEGVGSFEIRLLRDCPYCTLFITDHEIIWGLYLSDRRGVESAALRLPRRQSGLASQLQDHFKTQWRSSKEMTLVTFFENVRPRVGEEIVKKFSSMGSEV